MATQEELEELADEAYCHAKNHGYSPGEDDEDMLETAISEAACISGMDLTDLQMKKAIEILAEKLQESLNDKSYR